MSSPLHQRQGWISCQADTTRYRMAYREYWQGDAEAPAADLPVLICVHGLTRLGADFDAVARAMSQTHRVICPDIVGRGDSDWLPADAPSSHYQVPQYAADINAMTRALSITEADWLGTSMGGLIGLLIAFQANVAATQTEVAPPPSLRLRTLTLNDIGIRISQESLKRIASYVGHLPSWRNRSEALAFYQKNYAVFGINTQTDWEKFTDDSIRLRDGIWHSHYDPRIAEPFANMANADVDLTELMKSLTLPLFVIRGEHSDILQHSDYQEMCALPNIVGAIIPDCGHAPALIDPKQVDLIQHFIRGDSPSFQSASPPRA